MPVVSQHDPSIRFTNSTISALKPRLAGPPVSEKVFLLQPALRLRNLAEIGTSGRMSPFGCGFLALGVLAGPSALGEVAALAAAFFAELGFPLHRVAYAVHRSDADLLHVGIATGFPVQIGTESDRAFRHDFGIPGTHGRNADLSLSGIAGGRVVGNLILIERDGSPIGVELALGVTTIAAQIDDVDHVIWAGPAIAARRRGAGLIAADMLHASVILAAEGLPARARGRGGNYRSLLRVLAAHWTGSALDTAIRDVAASELDLRTHASPAGPAVHELDVPGIVGKVVNDLNRVG